MTEAVIASHFCRYSERISLPVRQTMRKRKKGRTDRWTDSRLELCVIFRMKDQPNGSQVLNQARARKKMRPVMDQIIPQCFMGSNRYSYEILWTLGQTDGRADPPIKMQEIILKGADKEKIKKE